MEGQVMNEIIFDGDVLKIGLDNSTPEDKQKIQEWYERMEKQFQEDSKTQDFSIPEEWDRDFETVKKSL